MKHKLMKCLVGPFSLKSSCEASAPPLFVYSRFKTTQASVVPLPSNKPSNNFRAYTVIHLQ